MADVNISKYRASVVRSGSTPATPGFVVSEGQNPVEPAGSEQNHLPVTINATATGLAITTDQVLSGAGTVGQYIRGDGSLADFPASTGGGSSVSYYLNGSISQGTIGGVAYKELSKTPILGAGTQFTINADGYIASFLTDAGDPNLLEIPGGNWNFETYFSASSGGGSPTFYVELYKYDGSTFTLIASNSGSPELIAFGTNVNSYFSTLAVPTTALTLTDRLAIRYYVTHSGRTITLHTENNTLCQIITTFTTGLTALNGLTAQVQYFAVGTSGTDFNIASATQTHTFNLPTASASNRGALSSSDWTTFNNKQNALTNPVTGTGTTNYLPKFTGTSSIGNSIVQDAGIRVDIGGDIRLTPTSSVNIQAYTGSVYTNLFYNAASHNWQNSGGATKMFLNSNDNLLIGTTTDGGQRLQVTGTFALRASASISSATQIPIFNADPSGTTRELVTRTPAQLLSDIGGQAALTNPVTGTGTTNYLPKFTGSTTIGNSVIQESSSNIGIGVNPLVNLQVGSSSSPTIGLNLTGSATSGSRGDYAWFNNAISTVALIRATAVTDNVGTQLEFYTRPAAGSLTQRLTLDSSGNLGLGVTPTNVSNYIRLQISGTTGGIFDLLSGSTRHFTIYNDSSSSIIGTVTNTPLIFQTNDGTKMTLAANGNLLVGTTTDNGAKLNVNGTVFIGNLASGSNAILDFATNASGGPRSIIYRAATAFLDFTNTAGSAVFQLSNGGAATFSGSVTAGADILTPTRVATDTINGYTGGSTPLTIQTGGAQEVRIGTNATTRLTISSTGAATFSSSVNVGGVSANTDFRIYRTVAPSVFFSISAPGGTPNTSILGINGTDVMSLNASGNVGIGTSSPALKLEVAGSGSLAYFRNPSSTAATTYITVINANNTSNGLVMAHLSNGTGYFGTQNSADLSLVTGDSPKMTITSSGNVWVGNDSNPLLEIANGGSTDVLSGIRWSVGGSRVDYGGIYSATSSANNNYISFYTKNSASAPSERMRITSGGNVLIGTTTDGGNGILQVNKSTSNAVARFTNPRNTSGDFALVTDLGSNCNNTSSYHYIAGTGGADKFYIYGNGTYATVSDRRLKKNIESVTEQFLEKVLALDIVTYNWNDQKDGSDLELGMIAQQVETAFPSIVKTNRPDLSGQTYKSIQASALPYILIKAIQEQQEIINDLKQKIQ